MNTILDSLLMQRYRTQPCRQMSSPRGRGIGVQQRISNPDLFIPGQVQILFKTERPENNTLSYTPHKGVTPPPGSLPSENFYFTTNFII